MHFHHYGSSEIWRNRRCQPGKRVGMPIVLSTYSLNVEFMETLQKVFSQVTISYHPFVFRHVFSRQLIDYQLGVTVNGEGIST
jgi:hypothetical protein